MRQRGSMSIFMVVTLIAASIKQSAAGYCEADNKECYSYHGYRNGPKKWPCLFPACDGDMQSPIDIQTKKVKTDQHLKKLSFVGYDTPIKRADVVNDGHTVMITPRDSERRGITVHDTEYRLQQLHFHWGSDSNPGADHTLNRRRFEMEMIEKENRAFKPIVEVLCDVLYKGDTTQLRSGLQLSHLLPECLASYYGYTGSLTVPPCTEGVAWFVLKDVQTIGSKQLNSFLKLYSVEKKDRSCECLLGPNIRPLQKLNGRVIYASP